jgi:hypothetical protein
MLRARFAMQKKIIQLEFNELCPALVDRFIAEGHLPNFVRLKNESYVFTTDAEEKAPNLEPWIQWVTVHTGLGFANHGVFDLGDGHKLKAPRIWDIVGQHGKKVWICGSMNASFQKPIQGFILPDPWSTGVHPYPDGFFDSFFNFIRANVQEHTRANVPVSKSDQLRFLTFMTTHGMKPETVSSIIKQLLGERGGSNRWKRAVILDQLQWDVFSWFWQREEPTFATFFLNSTAHFQHIYWRNMDPSVFSVKPSQTEQQEFSNAVLFGYQKMDAIVGKCLKLMDSNTIVVLATALSQQPCLKYENSGGKEIYRPENPAELFEFAGFAGNPEFAPVMSEQFRLVFDSEAEASDAAKALLGLRMGNRQVMLGRPDGNEVLAGCTIFERLPSDSMVVNTKGVARRFYELFYNCNLVKSGMHHPDGIFWISTTERASHIQKERIPLRSVAPTLLSLLGYSVPAFMELPALSMPTVAPPMRAPLARVS